VSKQQRTLGFIFLSTYLLVLLHAVVPHFHGEIDCISNDVSHQHDSHHHHDDGHHNHDSEDGILHALGHLFNGFHHLDMAEEHLTHLGIQMINFETSNSFVAVSTHGSFNAVSILFKNNENKNFSAYSAPPLEQLLKRALPLRAPPLHS
jgi:hypothetical protein